MLYWYQSEPAARGNSMDETATFRVTVVDSQGVVLDIYEAEIPVTGEPDANTARAAVLDVAESIRMGLA